MRKRQKGITLILAVLAVGVLFAMAALAIDWAVAYRARHELQNITDAAALAGAMELPDAPSAKGKAAEYYARNLPGNPTPTLIPCPSGFDPATTCYRIGQDSVAITTPYIDPDLDFPPPQLLHVRGCRTVRFFFAPLIGVYSMRVCAGATALKQIRFFGLIVLDPKGRKALSVRGSADVEVEDGGIAINSDSPSDALVVMGNASLEAEGIISVVGGYQKGPRAEISPTPRTDSSPISDPLADLSAPDPSGLPTYGGVRRTTGVVILNPGVYKGAIVLGGNAVGMMRPGVYILRAGLELRGNARLTGARVFLYFEGGGLKMRGTSRLSLSAPDMGAYKGIALSQGRSNNSPMEITGDAHLSINGTVYWPRGILKVTGSVEWQQRGILIVYRGDIYGNAEVEVETKFPPSAKRKGFIEVLLVE